MNSWVDYEFAERVFSVLPKFRRVSTGSQLKFNARCPICGDSLKDPNKARFWCYPSDSGLRVHCFNCDNDEWFSKFLKDHDETMYREYILEKRKDKIFNPEPKKVEISKKINSTMPVIEKLDYSERLDRLPSDHPIVKYVKNRCIPKEKYNLLWFTSQWQSLVNSIKPNTYKNERNECRLVIPIYNANKKIESIQGRALSKNAPQKYITIKAHDDASKIYGVERIDSSNTVYVMEGPIDTLFIDNSIAITGGSLDLNIIPFKDNRVWVMDNEPRHEDTIKRMKRLIDAGEQVVFWDKAPWKSKDINDMVSKEQANANEIRDYINNNYCSGLMAKLRLSKYSKV